ncbi:MAG TPA: hypothetical protein VGK41_01095 [Solirubrobacterales bacterium]
MTEFITFEELESITYSGSGGAAFRFTSGGYGGELGGGVGDHVFSLGMFGTGYADYADPEPIVPSNGFASFYMLGGGSGYSITYDDGGHEFSFGTMAFAGTLADDNVADGIGHHTFRLSGNGMHLTEPYSYGMLEAEPFIVDGAGGVYFEVVDGSLSMAHDLTSLPLYAIVERLRLQGGLDDTMEALSIASDRIELGDILAVVVRELATEGFVLGADPADNFLPVSRVVDALVLTGLASSAAEAVNIVIAALALGDLLDNWLSEQLTDGLQLGEVVPDTLVAAAALVEQILLAGDIEGSGVVLGIVLAEGVLLGAEPGNSLDAMALLQEGISFALHLNVDDGRYLAYCINTESKGLTQYRNYPFNSFAKLGGRYFGMTPDGIRELEGSDDAGSAIAASFRMSMTNLGGTNLKRMVAAYLGYTSTGALRLKTITVDQNGVKQANYYRLDAQNAVAPREARIKIGQGLRSVYWGFTVESIDGAAFMIDLLKLYPIVVGQQLQGQGGNSR